MLAKVEDVNNAVFLVGDRLGTQMFYGRGAGGDATGAAVVSDLVEIARDLAAGRLSAKNVVGFLESRELEIAPEPKPAGWYLRLTVNDERGIIARVAEILSREGMNIDSVQQEPHSPKTRLSLFFTVEPVLRTQSPQRHRKDQRLRIHGRASSAAADRVALFAVRFFSG